MTKNIDAHILKEFKIGQLMGSGAYGHVWNVQNKANSKKYALKKIFGAFRNSVDAQRTYRQVEILKQLQHPNIIKLQKVIGASNKQDLYLIFELMEADLLAVVGSNILSINHQKYILFQMLKAISYLHELKLIHRDLKPSNILLDSNCFIKICDFGLVRSLNAIEPDQQILSQEVATKWYRAPELLLGSRSYGYPVDLWSVGCIASQLLTGKTLFSGNSTLEQLQKIIEYSGSVNREDLESLDSPVAECLISQISPKLKLFSDYFSFVDPMFYPLLRGLLQFNPNKRLSAVQCLELDLFKEYRQQRIHKQKKQKVIQLSLDDNQRHRVRDYRDQIYSHLENGRNVRQYNGRVVKSIINKNKSLTKLQQGNPNIKSPLNKHSNIKWSSQQKNKLKSSQSPFIPKRLSKKQFDWDYKSLSKTKNPNPYHKSAKQILLNITKSSTTAIHAKKQAEGKLKKGSRALKGVKAGNK